MSEQYPAPDNNGAQQPGAYPPPAEGTYPPPAAGAYPPPAPGYAQPIAYGPTGQPLMQPSEQRTWAMFAHLGGILVSWLCPLIIYLVCKGRGAFVEDQAKEALNFQITYFIAIVASAILIFAIVGIVLLPIVFILAMVFGIMGSVKAYHGEPYRYPLNIRFIK